MPQPLSSDPSPQSSEKIDEDEKILAIMSYIPVICLIPVMQKERSVFVANHARLGFALFLVEILALLLRLRIIWDILIFLCICLALLGIFMVLKGKSYSVPFLSDLFGKH